MTKGKKIAIISVSALVALVVIAVIILAAVKSSFYTPCVKNAERINIYISGQEIGIGACTNPDMYEMTDDEGQEIFTTVMEKLENSNKESVLTCILAGAYSHNAEKAETKTEISEIKKSEVVVEFTFDSLQTLKLYDEEQKDNDGNVIRYNKIFLALNTPASNDLTETVIYLQNTNSSTSNFTVTYLSKQVELYEYLKGIEA